MANQYVTGTDLKIVDVIPASWGKTTSPPLIQENVASVYFNGNDGVTYVFGSKYTRQVNPFNTLKIDKSNVFNFYIDLIDETIVRYNIGDDVAPSHLYGDTLLANHGYRGCKYTATSHGKSNSDIGSQYTNGSNNYVLINVVDVDTLWVAETSSNLTTVYPDNSTLTYVSGGATTTDIQVTASTASQFYPCFQNYNLDVTVDGEAHTQKEYGIGYSDKVEFSESYELLSRDDIISWYVTSGDSSLTPTGTSVLAQSSNYQFDFEGNCTIELDFEFLAEISVQDIMGLQAVVAQFDSYYIPKTVEFTHEGEQLNYSMIEPSGATGIVSIDFTPEKLDDSAIPSDRWLQINGEGVAAMGFLPVKSAGINRALNVPIQTAQIRSYSDKIYPRLVDKGDFTSTIGEKYEATAYRIVHTPLSGATATYPVRTDKFDYYFIDYHNTTGTVNIPMPTDFTGEVFEIVESRNITCDVGIIGASLSCEVSCLDDYGYLVLQVGSVPEPINLVDNDNPYSVGSQWTYLGNGEWQYVGDGSYNTLQLIDVDILPDNYNISFTVSNYVGAASMAAQSAGSDSIFSTNGEYSFTLSKESTGIQLFKRSNSESGVSCIISNVVISDVNQ